jgi:hypothetical protein
VGVETINAAASRRRHAPPVRILALNQGAIPLMLGNRDGPLFVGELQEDPLPFGVFEAPPYRLKNLCEPRSHLMPMSSACRSLTPREAALGEETAGRALKKRNVGFDSAGSLARSSPYRF